MPQSISADLVELQPEGRNGLHQEWSSRFSRHQYDELQMQTSDYALQNYSSNFSEQACIWDY
jgi:hypothetical protein